MPTRRKCNTPEGRTFVSCTKARHRRRPSSIDPNEEPALRVSTSKMSSRRGRTSRTSALTAELEVGPMHRSSIRKTRPTAMFHPLDLSSRNGMNPGGRASL